MKSSSLFFLFCVVIINFNHAQKNQLSFDVLPVFVGKYGGNFEYQFQEKQTLGIFFDIKLIDKTIDDKKNDLADLVLFPLSLLASESEQYKINARQIHLGVSWRFFTKTPKNGAYLEITGGIGWYDVYFEQTTTTKTRSNNFFSSDTSTKIDVFEDRFST